MTLLLSHDTALRRLRMIGTQDAPIQDPLILRHPLGDRYFLHVPFADDEALSEIDFPWASHGKLDVIVPSGESRRHSSLLSCHTWGEEPPPNAFRLIGPHVLISSPEFTFLQMARGLDLIDLIRLGFELCGTYTIDSVRETGLSNRSPLTTPESLEQAAGIAADYSGRRKVTRALRHVLGGSASPRETDLVMLLTLPKRLGGYGLPKPTLNQQVWTGGSTSGYRYGDIFWMSALLDLEYESTLWHASPVQLARDSSRRAELREAGIDVITVTNDQVMDVHELDRIARLVEKALGIRHAEPDYDYQSRKNALREHLLGPYA